MQSKQYFTKIKNYPHEKSTEPNKELSQTGESINKAQTKETILNSYSEQPPLHKVYVKYILFIKMEHPIHQLPFFS